MKTNAYSDTVLADNPAAYYKLDDSAGAMLDSGTNNLSGAYGSGVTHGSPTMTSSGALGSTFPGGTYNLASFASVPPNAPLEPSRVSVEAWIMTSAVNLSNYYLPIVSFGRQSYGQAYVLQVTAQNALNFFVKTGPGVSTSLTSRTSLTPHVVYHVVATFDGTNANIYINGVVDATRSASGAPNYDGITTYGLAVGGAVGSGPMFNGEISGVAVYPTALAATNIKKHYLDGVIQPLYAETPANAAALVDSIGLVTHLHFTQSAYNANFPAVENALVSLGIHHIRDGLIDSTWQPYYDRLNELGRLGIHSTLTTASDTTMDVIKSYPTRVPDSLEAFEGWNEPNLMGDPNWAANTMAFQQQLYSTVKGDASLSKYAVLGPSVTKLAAAQALGDISSAIDYGNVHIYFGGYNPGTNGWGSTSSLGTYGSITYNMNYTAVSTHAKPIIVTETGYGTESGTTNTVTPRTQGIYMPRLYLEEYNHGIKRDFGYELLDSNEVGTFYHYGLLDPSMTPKPSYNALLSMMKLISDSGSPTGATTALTYGLGGDLSHVDHTLVQRSDGTYVLGLWVEVPSCDTRAVGTCTDLSIPTQNITVTLQRAVNGLTLHKLDDNGNDIASQPTIVNGTIRLTVNDHVSFLVFK